MSKVSKTPDGRLIVPDVVTIPFITGDGVGVEITPAMRQVVDTAVSAAYGTARRIDWMEVWAGERAFDKTGSWLPDETMEAFKEYLIGIKGPLTTPVGGGIRSLNVALRQTLDLYVCLRPVRWFKGVVSPVKDPAKVNMHIFRENTEDISPALSGPVAHLRPRNSTVSSMMRWVSPRSVSPKRPPMA